MDFKKETISKKEEKKLIRLLKKGTLLSKISYQNENICNNAIKYNPKNIEFVKEEFLTEELILLALRLNGWCIGKIKSPTTEMKFIAINQNGFAIKHIVDPTEEMKLLAIKREGLAIAYIENPSENMRIKAVEQNGLAVKYIENPSKEVVKAALNKNIYCFYSLKNHYEDENIKVFVLKNDKKTENILSEYINGKWVFSIGSNIRISKKKLIKITSDLNSELGQLLCEREYLRVIECF